MNGYLVSIKGCHRMIPFQDVEYHEKTCPFKPILCPIAKCDWNGTRLEFYKHFTDHPDNYLQNGEAFQHDIKTNNENTLLMMFYGLLFLVQFKVSRGSIWHCVRYIGTQLACSQFAFKLEIVSSEQFMSNTKAVAPQNRMLMEQACSIETSINSVLQLFKNFEEVYFKITIQTRLDANLLKMVTCTKCQNYSKEEIFRSKAGDVYCNECRPSGDNAILSDHLTDLSKELIYPCKYPQCTYKNLMKNVVKHEVFFCNFTKCLICKRIGDNKHNHYVQNHAKMLYNSRRIAREKISVKEFDYSFINEKNLFFICGYGLKENTYIFFVYADLPAEVLDLYECQVKIIHPKNGQVLERHGNFKCAKSYECIINIHYRELEAYLYNYKYNIIVEINQKKDV